MKISVIMEDMTIRKHFGKTFLVVTTSSTCQDILGKGFEYVKLRDFVNWDKNKYLRHVKADTFLYYDISNCHDATLQLLSYQQKRFRAYKRSARIFVRDIELDSVNHRLHTGYDGGSFLSFLQTVFDIQRITFSDIRSLRMDCARALYVKNMRFPSLEELSVSTCAFSKKKLEAYPLLVAPKLSKLVIAYDFNSISKSIDYPNTPLQFLNINKVSNLRTWKNVTCPTLKELIIEESYNLTHFKGLDFPELEVFRYRGQAPTSKYVMISQRNFLMFNIKAPKLRVFEVKDVVISRITLLQIPYESVNFLFSGRLSNKRIPFLCLDNHVVDKLISTTSDHDFKVMFLAEKNRFFYDDERKRLVRKVLV